MSFIVKFSNIMDKLADSGQNNRSEFDVDSSTLNIEKDIPYYNNENCKLDIYEKKDLTSKKPVLLLIHGGSFVAGDKYYRRLLSRWSADKGYFVVNINYGLGPKVKFPEPIIDVVHALNFIENNAEKYNLDLDRIVVNGDSAGAYLACALTIVSLNKELQDKLGVKISSKIKANILICGIYDFNYALKRPLTGKIMGSLLKEITGYKEKDIDKYNYKETINLLDYITKDYPKTFVSYSKKDIICGGQTQLFLKKAKELNLDIVETHSTKLFDNHCYSMNWVSKASRECNEKIASFMEDNK